MLGTGVLGSGTVSTLTKADQRDVGGNAMGTVKNYVGGMGWPLFSFFLVLCLAAYASMVAADRWLAVWVDAVETDRRQQQQQQQAGIIPGNNHSANAPIAPFDLEELQEEVKLLRKGRSREML